MTDDQIIDIFRSHDDGDDAGAVAVGRAIEKVAEADAIERCASMIEVYLADHGIEQARECLPDAIRALMGKEE